MMKTIIAFCLGMLIWYVVRNWSRFREMQRENDRITERALRKK